MEQKRVRTNNQAHPQVTLPSSAAVTESGLASTPTLRAYEDKTADIANSTKYTLLRCPKGCLLASVANHSSMAGLNSRGVTSGDIASDFTGSDSSHKKYTLVIEFSRKSMAEFQIGEIVSRNSALCPSALFP